MDTILLDFDDILEVLCPDKSKAAVELAERIRKEVLVPSLNMNVPVVLDLKHYKFRQNFLASLIQELIDEESVNINKIRLLTVIGEHSPSVRAANYYLVNASTHLGTTLVDLQAAQRKFSLNRSSPVELLIERSIQVK